MAPRGRIWVHFATCSYIRPQIVADLPCTATCGRVWLHLAAYGDAWPQVAAFCNIFGGVLRTIDPQGHEHQKLPREARECQRATVATYGHRWPQRIPSGSIWLLLAAYGHVLTACGRIVWHMAADGRRWPNLAAYGRIRPQMATNSHRWQHVATRGCRWPDVAACSGIWLQIVASGCRWPELATYGRTWPQTAASVSMQPQIPAAGCT